MPPFPGARRSVPGEVLDVEPPQLDHVLQSGAGDLYRYEYQRTGGNQVRAAFGDLDANVTANIGEGYVGSSNDLGCNASGIGASGAWLVGLLALRRRTTSARA